MALFLSKGESSVHQHIPLHCPKELVDFAGLPFLPSWVPDFRIENYTIRKSGTEPGAQEGGPYHLTQRILDGSLQYSILLTGQKSHHCATSSLIPILESVFSMDFTTLLVVGRLVDTIIWTFENLFEYLAATKDALHQNAMLQALYTQIPRPVDADADSQGR